jgi:hypothetical protein
VFSPSSLSAAIKATAKAGVAKTAFCGSKVPKSITSSTPSCSAAFRAMKFFPSPVTTTGTFVEAADLA